MCDWHDAAGQGAQDARGGDGAAARRSFGQVRAGTVVLRLLCSRKDKVRIIALYVMHRDGVPEEDRKRLYHRLGLDPQQLNRRVYSSVTWRDPQRQRSTKV